jgi:hypothetical protein
MSDDQIIEAGIGDDTTKIALDTSSLAQAIQSIIAENTPSETQRVNPAAYIQQAGQNMVELYDAYTKLRAIGVRLNGKLVSDPIPDTLQIEEIALKFRTVDDGQPSESQTVALKHLHSVGDISGILSTEIGAVIVLLQQETNGVLDIANKTKELCDKSRKAWEEANKDKQIREILPDDEAAAVANPAAH